AWWEHHRHRNDDRGGRNQTTGTATRTRARFDLACHPVKPVQCSSADPGTRRATRGTRHRPAGSCSEGGHRARDRNGFCCARARASRRAARRRRCLFHEPSDVIRGAHRASCDSHHLPLEIPGRCWRSDELWDESAGCLSANWCLHRPRAERRKTRRPADRAADEVRTGHQSKDRKGPRYCHSTNLARPCRRGNRMKRRKFITLLGATAAWPLAARAQQPGKLRTIGFSGQSTRSAESELVAAFTQRLRELGWIEGRTVTIEYRWSEGHAERFVPIATEFVRLKVDVIVTSGTPQVLATKQATS